MPTQCQKLTKATLLYAVADCSLWSYGLVSLSDFWISTSGLKCGASKGWGLGTLGQPGHPFYLPKDRGRRQRQLSMTIFFSYPIFLSFSQSHLYLKKGIVRVGVGIALAVLWDERSRFFLSLAPCQRRRRPWQFVIHFLSYLPSALALAALYPIYHYLHKVQDPFNYLSPCHAWFNIPKFALQNLFLLVITNFKSFFIFFYLTTTI